MEQLDRLIALAASARLLAGRVVGELGLDDSTPWIAATAAILAAVVAHAHKGVVR